MCQELKAEKNEFIQHQRKKLLQSGVYDHLDPKVERMIEAYYELERVRMKEYPVCTKTFNLSLEILIFLHSNITSTSISWICPLTLHLISQFYRLRRAYMDR